MLLQGWRGRARRFWRIAVLAFLAAAAAEVARADEVAALYQASWAGLPAAQIRLAFRDDPGHYRAEIAIGVEGLPWLFTHFRGAAVGEGRLVAGRGPEPVRYDAFYDLHRRTDRRVAMRFVGPGGARLAERGPEDTSTKPPLEDTFRRNVLDPLSVVAAIRDALLRGNRTGFTIPSYDGARRFDTVVQMKPAEAGDGPGLHLDLVLRPVAGFKDKKSEDGDPEDAPRPLSLTLTDDTRLMPLAMRVSIAHLPLVVELSRWCENGKPCQW